jgi:hypothetical protein
MTATPPLRGVRCLYKWQPVAARNIVTDVAL